MAIHPFFKALVSEPDLLAEHAGAYVALASAELGAAARGWRRRLLLQVLAAGLGLLGLGLGGVAALLAAALPRPAMPAPWLLAALPLALLALAAVLGWWQARAARALDLDTLRQQWDADRALWREAAHP